jgi:hypothetical protein
VFADEGGAWVWRHDNGNRRDYFVKEQKVVQYFIKPIQNQEDSSALEVLDRTIIGKQWVSQDVLQQSGHHYTTFGEGSWAIEAKLSPVSGRYQDYVLLYLPGTNTDTSD